LLPLVNEATQTPSIFNLSNFTLFICCIANTRFRRLLKELSNWSISLNLYIFFFILQVKMVHNRKPRLPYRICSAIGQCLLKPWLNKGVPSKFLLDLCHLPNSNNQ
jgi:hypothetical protein